MPENSGNDQREHTDKEISSASHYIIERWSQEKGWGRHLQQAYKTKLIMRWAVHPYHNKWSVYLLISSLQALTGTNHTGQLWYSWCRVPNIPQVDNHQRGWMRACHSAGGYFRAQNHVNSSLLHQRDPGDRWLMEQMLLCHFHCPYCLYIMNS